MDKSKDAKKVRYWITYRMPDGKQRKEAVGAFEDLDPTSITDAKDALAKRQVQRRERRIFDMLPEAEMTFDELSYWYLNLKSVRKLVAFDRYEQALNNFSKVFGKTYLNDIRQTDLEEYQIERKGQGAADATVDYELKIAQAAANKAFDNDKVDGACLKPFRRTKHLLKFGANARDAKVTVEQYLKLLDRVPSYYRPALIIAYNTGMRMGEIKALKWSHIDWDNMMIRLPKEITKESKPKSIPINHHVKEVLDKLPRTIHDFIITYKGRPMTGKNHMRSPFPKACKKAGIPYGRKQPNGITFHDMRTAVKSYMEEAGVGEARRDAILGHSKKGMDKHYLFLSDESLRKGMDQYTAWLDEQINALSENVAHFVAQEAI
jgi:integrase